VVYTGCSIYRDAKGREPDRIAGRFAAKISSTPRCRIPRLKKKNTTLYFMMWHMKHT